MSGWTPSGMRTPTTFSRPYASTHSAAITELSLPPEIPTTAVLPPQLFICARIQSSRAGMWSAALKSLRSYIACAPFLKFAVIVAQKSADCNGGSAEILISSVFSAHGCDKITRSGRAARRARAKAGEQGRRQSRRRGQAARRARRCRAA